MKTTLSIALLIAFMVTECFATIIDPANRTDWTPGVTVGVHGDVPSPSLRSNLINVTSAPYNADNSGSNNCTTAIQDAINAASADDVVYFPAGYYQCTGNLFVNKSSITLRGAVDANGEPLASIVSGSGPSYLLTIGGSENAGSYYTITNGATKGSTNLVVDAAMQGTFGELVAGDMVVISQDNDTNWFVISTGNFNNRMVQHAVVYSKSGANLTLTTPLVADFTNRPSISVPGFWSRTGIGIEGLRLTRTNDITHEVGTAQKLIVMGMVHDSWVVNCDLADTGNYNLETGAAANITIRHNRLHSSGTGSNHAGLLLGSSSCLIEDNIFYGGLQPAIECNFGSGNAFFANFFTNCVINIDYHGAHPFMNVFEQNVTEAVIMDGYFGSVSHQTYLRNAIYGAYSPVIFRRWSTRIQMVGNVIGNPSYTYPRYVSELTSTDESIYSLGHPNIGNPSFSVTNTSPFNYPGTYYFDNNGAGITTYTPYVFTNTQGPTNVLWGDFSATGILPYASVLRLLWQDNINTNVYYGAVSGSAPYPTEITSSNMTLSESVVVSNGWTMFVAGAPGWQQLQIGDKFTDVFAGNYDYFNNAVVWTNAATGTNAAETIPTSFLYTSAPSWWGTNRWPAIDPEASTRAAPIPAEQRYYGIDSGPAQSQPATTTKYLRLRRI